MTIKVLMGRPTLPRSKAPSVVINPKLWRLQFNSQCMKLFGEHVETSDYVRILVDDDKPNTFWVQMCGATSEGAVNLVPTGPRTRTCRMRHLMKDKQLKFQETKRFDVTWDHPAIAVRIDMVT